MTGKLALVVSHTLAALMHSVLCWPGAQVTADAGCT